MRQNSDCGAAGYIERAAFPFTIETAGEDADGRFRVRGVMNSFAVMQSGRLLHPAAYKRWIKARGNATVPMLANHGQVNAGFASIGVWDEFDFVEGKGAVWGGYIAKGTKLADEARALLEQKILRQLSVGWNVRQARYVTDRDTDLDPFVKRALEDAGANECLCYFDWTPVEGSVVDVADDPDARIARNGGAGENAAVTALRGEVASLRAELAALRATAGGPAAALTHELFSEFLEDFKAAALEALHSVELLDGAASFSEDLVAGVFGDEISPAALADVQDLIAGFGQKAGEV